MKAFKKRLLPIALLMAALTLITACGSISQETAEDLLSVAGEILTNTLEEAVSDGSAAEEETAAQAVASEEDEDASDDLSKAASADTAEAEPATKEAEETAQAKATEEAFSASETASAKEEPAVVYGQSYLDKDSVALYLYTYGELPPNYLTKSEAETLGWVASKKNLWNVTDHGAIGGDRFGNYEKLLPVVKGRTYYECDVNYDGGYRNGERLIFSNDGAIYYTNDHYASFTLLYGEE